MKTKQGWDRQTSQALPDSEVTHFHLLRHGQVETGGVRRVYGHTDLPLSVEGWKQAESLLSFCDEFLASADGILSSDLRRCMDIAEPLAERLNLPLHVHPELREQFMGEWEGRSWIDLTDEDVEGVRAYWTDYAHTPPPGGESFQDLVDRIGNFLRAQMPRLRGGRWLLVGHTGVVRAMICQMMKTSASDGLRYAPLPGTHTWLIWAESGAVIQTLGERPRAISAGAAGVNRAAVTRREGPVRLAFSGSAGTGKTTLGRRLAAHWELPFVPEGMRSRIEAGLALHRLTESELRELILELWRERCENVDQAIASTGGFVADRSPMDYLAFWLHYGFAKDRARTEALAAEVRARSQLYDRIVVMPWGVLPLQADGIRSSNPWLQLHFQATVEGLLHRELGLPIVVELPALRDLEARASWVIDQVQESGVRRLQL